MDCCNYAPYGAYQRPYYGCHPLPPSMMPYPTQYHDAPLGYHYPAPYQEYCYGGAPPYYGQMPQWNGGYHETDYVYNPKEARIRKAMRDALRDRSAAGASPLLPRPSARRPTAAPGAASLAPPPWMTAAGGPAQQPPAAHHEELGMQPPSGSPSVASLRPRLPSPSDGVSSPYAVGVVPPPPSPYGPTSASATVPTAHDYMQQPNPLTQLQRQTEMWSSYPAMTSRSPNTNFLMHDTMSSHFHQQQSPGPGDLPASSMMIEKHPQHQIQQSPITQTSMSPIDQIDQSSSSIGPTAYAPLNQQRSVPTISPYPMSLPLTPPHCNENVPPEGVMETKNEGIKLEQTGENAIEKQNSLEGVLPLMECSSNMQQGEFTGYGGIGVMGSQTCKAQDLKVRKAHLNNTAAQSIQRKQRLLRPLPAFNAAFGSTERGGRFQRSPPEPPPIANFTPCFDDSAADTSGVDEAKFLDGFTM